MTFDELKQLNDLALKARSDFKEELLKLGTYDVMEEMTGLNRNQLNRILHDKPIKIKFEVLIEKYMRLF